MTDQLHRVRIYTPGASDTSSSNVDFTLQTALAEAPTVSSPLIRPLQGRAEASPWEVTVVDHGSSFSADLADSSGRLDLLTRLIKVQRQRNSTSWTDIGTGRIADVFLGEDVASYRIVVEDERILERQATVFNTTNTTRLFPPGPHTQWGAVPPPPKGTVKVLSRTADRAKLRFDAIGATVPGSLTNLAPFTVPPVTVDAIEQDLEDAVFEGSTAGNFKHLRLRVGNTDYPIVAFLNEALLTTTSDASPLFAEGAQAMLNAFGRPALQVIATSSQLALNTEYSSAFLHMFSAPPSLATPLHIGGSTGLFIADLIEDVYQGAWSSSETAVPRFSTAALDLLRQEPLPLVRFRITDSSPMDEWPEQNLYAPFMVVPFVDTDGMVAPKSVALPGSSTGITFTFNQSNLAEHPTWGQMGRELVTVLEVDADTNLGARGNTIGDITSFFETGGDLISRPRETRPLRFTHDRASKLGMHVLRIRQRGLGTELTLPQSPINLFPTQTPLSAYLGFIRHEIFNRFGDGPVYGTLVGLSAAESVEPGDFVKVDLATFPNPQVQGRGGVRIVQILQRDDTPAGPTFQYLDAGPNLQAVTAPTLTLSTSTADPKHSLLATVGALSSQGASFQLQLANSTALPASTSPLWIYAALATQTSGTYQLTQKPSGETFFARARALRPGRIKSSWTTSTGKTTQSITAPSALAMSSNLATWTPGDNNYETEFFGDDSTSAAFGSSNRLAILPPASNRFRLDGVTSTGTVLVGLRHRDPYGGVSGSDSTTFVRSVPTLADPLGLAILWGRST